MTKVPATNKSRVGNFADDEFEAVRRLLAESQLPISEVRVFPHRSDGSAGRRALLRRVHVSVSVERRRHAEVPVELEFRAGYRMEYR